MNDVTGLAVALTASARTKAQQLARELRASHRRLNATTDGLVAAKRDYAKAASEYRALYQQAAAIWTGEELQAAGAVAPPSAPNRSRDQR